MRSEPVTSQSEKDNDGKKKYEATPTPVTVPRVFCTELFRKKNTCLNLISFVFYVKEENNDGAPITFINLQLIFCLDVLTENEE